MSAFLGISLWIVLATVIPGLITITTLFGAFAVADPALLIPSDRGLLPKSDWIIGGIAVTLMILTQAIGILWEELCIKRRWYPNCEAVSIPQEDPSASKIINAYEQFSTLYILLAQLKENEDTQGHLKRCAAQFFLTNNTLVSFTAGIVAAIVLMFYFDQRLLPLMAYTAALIGCLLVSFWVGVIRFKVMAKSIWATKAARQ